MVNYLYIHIPFCIAKCDYCDFYSVPIGISGKDRTDEYTDVLLREMAIKKDVAGELKAVYIGGGTPTLLSVYQTDMILSAVRDYFSPVPEAEVTSEANPGTVTEELLAGLRAAGITRVSIGMQSFSGAELCKLGRSHSVDEGLLSVKAARSAGFGNISLDLIYGIPGQVMEGWLDSLDRALELSPEHLSVYELTPEESTLLDKKIKQRIYELPDEGLVTDMYYAAREILISNGYIHYEISNYAKPGYECRHNLNYWNRGEYLGIGAGAHSYYQGKRTGNVRDLSRYIGSIRISDPAVEEEIIITEQQEFNETIFLGLRKTEGINLELVRNKDMFLNSETLEELVRHKLVETEGPYLRLTAKGLVLSSEVMVKLIR